MSFPTPKTEFPPKAWQYWFKKYAEWAAWYSGDPERLLQFYTAMFPSTEEGKFWASQEKEERSSVVHLPAAGDIASMSANLLFSESPVFQYNQKASGGDRIETFIKENGLLNALLEGAELAAAFSGVFLKLDIEPDLVKIPILSIRTPQQAFPVFRRGRLWEVTFYRVVLEEKDRYVWRLFENRRRENGQCVIEYKLFRGKSDDVGQERSLDELDETSRLGLENVTYNIDGLACVYVPNMRPNKLAPGSALGINDYSSCITLLDSLDFAWSSWMRDIELGMSQILVDEELLDFTDKQGHPVDRPKFSKLQKAFVKLNLSPWRINGEKVKPIEQIQFDIRVDEHSKTCEALVHEIITRCGYSPQSFGLGVDGRAESGTALRTKERKSLLTRDKKSRYWQPPLWELFWQMQQLDSESGLSATRYTPQEVKVIPEDSIIVDPKEQSEIIRNLDMARAVSTYMKVKKQHPEWDDEEIEREVTRINKEQGVVLPDMDMDFAGND